MNFLLPPGIKGLRNNEKLGESKNLVKTQPILQSPFQRWIFVIALADLKFFCSCLILLEFLLLTRYFWHDYRVLVRHVYLFKILSKRSPYFRTALDLITFPQGDLQREIRSCI